MEVVYLDACVFLLSFLEQSLKLDDNVESFRESANACTSLCTTDMGLIETL